VCATINLHNRKDSCPNAPNSLAGMGTKWAVCCLKEHECILFKKEKHTGNGGIFVLLEHDSSSLK